MNMNQTLQKIACRTTLFFKQNSSSILTGAAAIGLLATAVAAAVETPKAMTRLNIAKEKKGEDLTPVESVVTVAPAYIPAAIIGASTIACIFGANVLSQHKQAALASAYALADSTYRQYRGKVVELLGKDTDERIIDAIAKEKRNEDTIISSSGGFCALNSLPYTGEVVTFYDEFRGTYFEAPMDAVLNAEYHLNRNFSIGGFVTLNDFYRFLGLEEIEFGDVLGWSAYKMASEWESSWIDFNHRLTTMDDGFECYIIEMPIPPTEDFYEEW